MNMPRYNLKDWNKAKTVLHLGQHFNLVQKEDYQMAFSNWKELTVYARRRGDDACAAELSWAKEVLKWKWNVHSNRICECGHRKYPEASKCSECRTAEKARNARPPFRQSEPGTASCLDPRQRISRLRTVLKMRTEGLSFDTIARNLGISRKGVEYHWAQIQKRTGLRDLALLTQWGLRAGITEWKLDSMALQEAVKQPATRPVSPQ